VAASRRRGSRRPRLEARLARVARQVLAWEGASDDRVELTLLDGAAMRRLNRRATGRRGLTDVITFSLPQPDGTLVGDVYICPEAARQWVKGRGRVNGGGRGKGEGEVVEELIRLAVHGTLHVLGFDHPDGPGRTHTAMWHRQERYVRRLTDGDR
jgi:probable rRNA maturation factor